MAHSEREHTLLSPSASHRWMNCTPSALLEYNLPSGKEESVPAMEGTLAHEISEHFLNEYLKGNFDMFVGCFNVPEQFENNPLFGGIDMIEHVNSYVLYVIEKYEELKALDSSTEMELEKKYDVSEYAEGMKGSCDCRILGNGELWIIDLKYGKGVRVDVKDNSQLRSYGLGAYGALTTAQKRKVKTIHMSIAQVRLNSFPVEVLPKKELMGWGNKELRPKAYLAFRGLGDFRVGDWCRFCALKVTCKAQYEALRNDFDDLGGKQLTETELASLIGKLGIYEDWIKSVYEHAYLLANSGIPIPGYKLVNGRTTRKIVKPEELIEALKKLDIAEDDYMNKSLIGIGDLEKLIGKKRLSEEEAFSTCIAATEGKPTLAKISDERESVTSATSFDDLTK